MIMNAGFFSYIMFQTNYTAWTRSLSPFYKEGIEIGENTPYTSHEDLIKDDSKISHLNYQLMMRIYAALFIVTMFYYWYIVY